MATDTPSRVRELWAQAPEKLEEDPRGILALAIEIGQGAPLEPPPEEATLNRLRREVGRLVRLPAAELRDALDGLLATADPGAGLRWLSAAGGLRALLPEVEALRGFQLSGPVRHKDLWEHTLSVVQKTPAEVDLRWVALMHDTGKVATRMPSQRGASFWRHEQVSAWLWRGVAARLQMPPERVERVAFVTATHARVNAYLTGWTDRAVARLVREAGPYLADLLRFSASDFTTQRAGRVAKIRERLAHLEARIAALPKPRDGSL
jgi:poly(A) polymerase